MFYDLVSYQMVEEFGWFQGKRIAGNATTLLVFRKVLDLKETFNKHVRFKV